MVIFHFLISFTFLVDLTFPSDLNFGTIGISKREQFDFIKKFDILREIIFKKVNYDYAGHRYSYRS